MFAVRYDSYGEDGHHVYGTDTEWKTVGQVGIYIETLASNLAGSVFVTQSWQCDNTTYIATYHHGKVILAAVVTVDFQ